MTYNIPDEAVPIIASVLNPNNPDPEQAITAYLDDLLQGAFKRGKAAEQLKIAQEEIAAQTEKEATEVFGDATPST